MQNRVFPKGVKRQFAEKETQIIISYTIPSPNDHLIFTLFL